jgi:hypothetical protein
MVEELEGSDEEDDMVVSDSLFDVFAATSVVEVITVVELVDVLLINFVVVSGIIVVELVISDSVVVNSKLSFPVIPMVDVTGLDDSVVEPALDVGGVVVLILRIMF